MLKAARNADVVGVGYALIAAGVCHKCTRAVGFGRVTVGVGGLPIYVRGRRMMPLRTERTHARHPA